MVTAALALIKVLLLFWGARSPMHSRCAVIANTPPQHNANHHDATTQTTSHRHTMQHMEPGAPRRLAAGGQRRVGVAGDVLGEEAAVRRIEGGVEIADARAAPGDDAEAARRELERRHVRLAGGEEDRLRGPLGPERRHPR